MFKHPWRKITIFVAVAMTILMMVMVLLAALADAATYYCRADGTAASKAAATSDAAAATSMTLATHQAQTYSAGDVIVISDKGGAYAAILAPPSSGGAGNPIIYQASGTPVITSNGSYGFRIIGKSYLTITGITFTSKLLSIESGSAGIIFNKCIGKAITSGAAVGVSGASTVTFNNCVFHANTGAMLEAIGVGNTGNTITIKNCLVYGNNDDTSPIRVIAGNTVDYDYNLVIGNIYQLADKVVSLPVGSDGGHNIILYEPKVTGYRNGTAYFSITVDDQDAAYARQIADIMPAGTKMTMFVIAAGLNATQQENIQYLHNNGHEIAGHGYSHSLPSASTAFAVTTTNANPTVNVDVAGYQIVLSTTTGGNTVTLGWTGDKKISDLKTAVTGKGWTITNTENVQNSLLLSSLADSSGAQAAPYTTNLDKTANGMFYQNEITYAHSILDAITGGTVTTFSYPFGVYDSGMATYMQTNGIQGARLNYTGEYNLSSLNIYKTFCPDMTTLKGDGTEATIRTLANAYYAWAKDNGAFVSFIVHDATEFSVAQWAWFLDELNELGAEILPYRAAIGKIKGDHSTADNLTYAKTYADVSDYRLTADSDAIDAGTTITGVTTDIEGVAVPYSSAPDIGAYEHHDTFVYGKGRLSSGTGITTVTRP